MKIYKCFYRTVGGNQSGPAVYDARIKYFKSLEVLKKYYPVAKLLTNPKLLIDGWLYEVIEVLEY